MLCINYLSIIIIEKRSIRNIWRQKQYFPLKVGVCPGADCVAACGDCPVTAARSRTLAPLLPRTQCWLVRAEISLKIDHTHTPDTPDILHYCRSLYCLALRQCNAKHTNYIIYLNTFLSHIEEWRLKSWDRDMEKLDLCWALWVVSKHFSRWPRKKLCKVSRCRVAVSATVGLFTSSPYLDPRHCRRL